MSANIAETALCKNYLKLTGNVLPLPCNACISMSPTFTCCSFSLQ